MTRGHLQARRLGALLAPFLLAATLQHPHCAAAPREVPLGPSKAARAADVRQPTDLPTTIDAIVFVLSGTLRLPMPSFTMELHAQPAEFEQALVAHLKLKPEVARTTASFAKAAVGNRRVLVNEPALATLPWPERVVTVAHEMVHATQLELAGHRSMVRFQWLIEGFAEWAAYQVADELRVTDATARSDIVARVRAVYKATGLVPLAQADTFEQWVNVRKQRGFDATYPYMLLAVEFLVQRHSYQRVLDYFGRYRESGDATGNFRAAFGETLEQFQPALDAHMAAMLQ